MKALIEYIAKALVEHPEQVQVRESGSGSRTRIELSVSRDDMGRIIGKSGKVANSIRTLLRVAAEREGKQATLDVVEIDPAVTDLAKQYFNLKADPRLAIFHEDGRVFLNMNERKYDAILGDAFTSQLSLPYQLTTREAVQKKYDALNEGGVVIVNIISSIEGEKGQFLRAEYQTFKSVFPQVHLFPVASPDNGSVLQNIILVALKSTKEPLFENDDPELNDYLGHRWTQRIDDDMPILTDDFAPVDHYIRNLI